jgi:hypothetical protein
MKLLFSTLDMNRAMDAKLLLEQKGIPVFLSNKHQYHIRRSIPNLVGVWLYINNQKADAIKILKNPDYQASQPVDVKTFYNSLEEGIEAKTRGFAMKWLIMALVAAMSFTILSMYLILHT